MYDLTRLLSIGEHLIYGNGWSVISASGEARWHWRQIRLCSHLQDQVHADDDVEQEVAMEEPGSCELKKSH